MKARIRSALAMSIVVSSLGNNTVPCLAAESPKRAPEKTAPIRQPASAAASPVTNLVSSPAAATAVTLRGRVVCLAESFHRRFGTELPNQHPHFWGFQTDDDQCFTLVRTRFSEALFVDERLREKTLLVQARLLPQSHTLDLTHLQSLQNGQVHDLYYYCVICAIKSVAPEVCACCQGPMELVERPSRERQD